MKKIFNLLMIGLMVLWAASCDKPQPEPDKDDENTETPVDPGTGEGGDQGNTGDLPKNEFPFVAEFPIECGNLISEGSDVGVTIEVTYVDDRNFVFELRP